MSLGGVIYAVPGSLTPIVSNFTELLKVVDTTLIDLGGKYLKPLPLHSLHPKSG